ncbi:hypothetical protein PF003_g38853 [Phytophthora fragariae]|nr:hypothetical protein PF003_g38853 [Phytophthora fragariae]
MALSVQHVHLAVHATLQQRQRDARLSPVTPRGHRRLRESLGENVSRIRRLRFDRIREVLEVSRVNAVVSTTSVAHKFNKRSQSLIRTVTSGASAQGADAIGPNVERRFRRQTSKVKKAHRLWEPTLQAVRTVANVPHRKCLRGRVQPGCTKKRCAIKPGLIACARRVEPAGDQKEDLSAAGPGQNKTRGTGFRTRSERRKRAKLRKSRSGTEGATRSVCRADTGTGDDRRDTERLDAHEYCSPV